MRAWTSKLRRGAGWLLGLALGLSLLACGSGLRERRTCGGGKTRCEGVCVSLADDAANCGQCGLACRAEQVCVERACVAACPIGQSLCDGACVDRQEDPRHCGACGNVCGPGESCQEGGCRPPCGGTLQSCRGACVNLQKDASNCGGCGYVCGADESCVEGRCEPLCPEGETLCAASCVSIQSDDAHCGGCGLACGAGERCVEGSCVCEEGLERCGSACVDTGRDPSHCGTCFNSCRNRANASASFCDEGLCAAVCDAGYEDCDGAWATGCEVDLLHSKRNCGACDNDCEAKHGVAAANCGQGRCQVVKCLDGWGDCDADGANGCETQVLHDPDHCGACGVACALLANTVDTACEEGRCAFACADGWGDCDGEWSNGCESELRVDGALHCGACNQFCASYEICSGGSCVTDLEWANWPMPPERPSDYDLESKEGVAIDRLTGLEWAREASENVDSLGTATAYCSSLELGGHADWRLPTVIELVSLLYLQPSVGSTPMLNPTAFPDEPAARHWSSTPYIGGGASPSWAVDFRNGSISRVNAVGHVRCVRGGFVREERRYVVKDGMVEDRHTGLLWTRAHRAGIESPQDGLAWCKDRAVGGYEDWRIPTLKELMTLVDVRELDPTLDREAFASTRVGPFWSWSQRGQSFFVVNFGPGTSQAFLDAPGTQRNVRCVRDAVP